MTRERVTFSTRRFLVGKAGPFPRLVFREEVMLSLDQFAHFHPRGEHGGFLIGRKRYLNSAEQYEIIVERFVPIPQRDDASRLVINQEHLQSVRKALRGGERGEEIVGWAHTHPGFGAFLSRFDKEQHLRFFPEPWQIAYVMDNQTHERAAYHLVNEEWSRLGGYYVLKEMAGNEVAAAGHSNLWIRSALGVLLLLLFIGAGTYGYTLVRQLLTPEPENTQVVFSGQEAVITVQQKETPPQAYKTEGGEMPASNAVAPPKAVPLYGEYIVQRGDNLWKIAQKLWGDPSLFSLLAEENGITNPSVIPVGKVLRVPQRPNQ